MDPLSLMLGVLAAIALVLLNAFFVAAEFSIVKVRVTQLAALAKRGGATSALAIKVTHRLDAYLAACQVGITFASLGLGWIGEPAIAAVLEPPLGLLFAQFAPAVAHAIALAMAFAFISGLHIVLGELAPKSFAIQKALPTTLWVVWPLHVFYTVFFPLIWALNGVGNWLVRRLGLQPATVSELVHSPEELRLLARAAREAGALEPDEHDLLENVLRFGERTVREAMIPRTELIGIEATVTVRDALELARQRALRRFPVYRDDLDDIVGVAHLRDLIGVTSEAASRRPVTELMRPVAHVPESMPLNRAFAEMRRQRTWLFVVVDEFGGTAGLVTVEGILEELVGEMEETQPGAPQVRAAEDGSYLVDGMTALDELRERFGLALEGERYQTVGGFVFGRLGRIGRAGDSVEVDGAELEVTAVDGRRIAEVRLRLRG